MLGVVGNQVGAQHQHADPSFGGFGFDHMGQVAHVGVQAVFHARVVGAHLGVLHRFAHLHHAAAQGVFCIAIDQHQHHVVDVLLRAAQPVLQAQKVKAQILGRAGYKAQDLRQAAQHLHLFGAR